MNQATGIIVQTGDPAGLDRILQQFGAFVAQTNVAELREKATYEEMDGGYVVCCLCGVDLVERMIQRQGYGTVLKRI